MPTATLSSKGRITIPKDVRAKLNLKPGSRISFVIDPSGSITLTPLAWDFRSLRGIVRSKRKRTISIEEMNDAIARGYASK
jgi:AbrB family looped-hinge helix DNA binding protein